MKAKQPKKGVRVPAKPATRKLNKALKGKIKKPKKKKK